MNPQSVLVTVEGITVEGITADASDGWILKFMLL